MGILLLIVLPLAIGALLGTFVPVRRRVVLVLPALALGIVYSVAVGWYGDDYEIGRHGLVLFTGVIAGAFVVSWTVGVALGHSFRATWRGRAES